MDKEIKISVIVPIFNAEEYIDRCVSSLVLQKYKNIEIILVDDGSNDRSLEICNSYKKIYDNIKVFSKTNTGVSDTRNYGISKSTGDYITFVDSDDCISKDYVVSIVKKLQENNCDLIRTGYTLIKNNREKKLTYIKQKQKIQNFEDVINGMLTTNLFNSSCMFFIKRSFLIENGIKFDKKIKYGEDLLFSIECYSKAKKIIYLNNYGYFYMFNNKNASSTTDVEKRIKYCKDNIFVYSKLYEYNLKKDYISFNIYNKISYAMKFVLLYNNVNYKKFEQIIKGILNDKAFNVIDLYCINKVEYNQSKTNKFLVNLLSKKRFFLYYIIIKMYKIMKWR